MNLSLIIFLVGVLGFVLNRKNIILMLISIEILLLAITFLILIALLNFYDIFRSSTIVIDTIFQTSTLLFLLLILLYKLTSYRFLFIIIYLFTIYIS